MEQDTVQISKEQYDWLNNKAAKLSSKGLSHADVVQMNEADGRWAKAHAYETWQRTCDRMKSSRDPRVKAAWDRENKQFLQVKDVSAGTVHQNATLSNVSIQYANEDFIGEQLMPVVQVSKESDIYYLYPRGERMQYPDDELGSRAKANEIQETRTTDTYTCTPFGYSNYVAQRTLNNQDAPLDEMMDLVDGINEGLAYRRELRIAAILTATGSFGSGQFNTIAAADRWDSAGGGDPIGDIQTAMAALWRGRGPGDLVAYSGLTTLNALSRHQSILDLFKYNGSSPGLATPSMVAGFFGINKYLVGKARTSTAAEGQTDVFARAWNQVFGIVRVARRPTRRNASFGYTLRHGNPITVTKFDPLSGHGGGYTAQVSVSETHKVVSAPTGYLINTPTA